ncbi:MAG TPA: class I adenylate-forming enzyme family protein [Stellaceae bacterium]|nr:class I adenylate-forming enzyme family protein [Stellaceae bacterium]
MARPRSPRCARRGRCRIRTLYELLAAPPPETVAVISGGRETTYAELAEAAARLAGGMRERGIGRGSRVGVLIENRVEWLESVFAAALVGAAAVPLSTWSKPAELAFLIADARLDMLVTVGAFGGQDFAAALDTLGDLPPVVILDGEKRPGWIAYRDLAGEPPGECPARPEDDCLILYTSGSSAHPKAVRLSHGRTVENGFQIGERMGLAAADRVLLAPPLFWAYGACNALPVTLSHGAALVLQPRFEPGGWLDLIERHRCTAVYTLPSLTGAALRHPEFRRQRTASLRTGLMIGSPEEVRVAADELAAPQICNIYGATETYGNCCVTPAGWPLARRMGSQGPPLPGVRLRIVDAGGAEVSPGEVGAVEVADSTTPGYAGASAAHNAAVFTADGFFRTGDLGSLDAAGDFHFAARDNDMIKRAGINVSPAEIESLILQYPGVAQVAVVGAAAGERGEAIVAFVVAAEGVALDGEALRAHCRALASSYKVPDRVELCAALPTTETGKLFRRGLKEIAARLYAGQAA